jgi:hypothetical protein
MSATGFLVKLLIMGLLGVALGYGLLWMAATVWADELPALQAASSNECREFADMAITIRAMAQEGVTKDQAAGAVARIYSMPEARIAFIAAHIMGIAYSDKREAADFANQLAVSCISHRGDLGPFLGGGV